MRRTAKALQHYIRDNAPRPVTFRELMLTFNVTKGERPRFKAFVDNLVDEGELVRLKGNLFTLPSETVLVTGTLATHRDGYGFVAPDAGGDDIFIPARYLRENLHGDRVEVQVVPKRQEGKREGRIVRTIERGQSRIVGRFESSAKGGRVRPDDHRIPHDITIPPAAFGRAKSGQTVVAEITAWPGRQRGAQGRVVEVLGWPDEPEVEVQTIIRKYDLPLEFSPAALKAARGVSQEIAATDLAARTDLRALLTVTIDGETARDFDDAVAIRREGEGLFRLWVSIADVSHYVRPASPLDSDAYLRGTSVYFPDRCLPMLPEELSNGICSLNPRVDRLTVTAEMLFDASGTMREARFYPSVINSDARLTYTIVKQIVVDNDPDLSREYAALVPDLVTMKELALILMAKRRQRGSIDFDLPEPQIILDLQGGTQAIVKAERNLAHRIIEEFMLAANEAVATFLEERAVPSLYRVHETPAPAKLRDFQEFIHGFGYEFRMDGDRVAPVELQRVLAEVEGKAEEKMINQVLLRCMKQARYAAENLGHFGLAAASYTHFTSPIRRYPDLVVHRILKKALAGRLGEGDRERLVAELPPVAEHTSKRERVAMEAEREIVELKKLQFMQDKVGEEYDGFITGVTSFGLFVELGEYFVEGLVHITTLPSDFYKYMEKQHSLVGERSRVVHRIGDRVRVRLDNVSLERRQIDFTLLTGQATEGSARVATEPEEYRRVPIKGKKPAGFASGKRGSKGPERQSSRPGRKRRR